MQISVCKLFLTKLITLRCVGDIKCHGYKFQKKTHLHYYSNAGIYLDEKRHINRIPINESFNAN